MGPERPGQHYDWRRGPRGASFLDLQFQLLCQPALSWASQAGWAMLVGSSGLLAFLVAVVAQQRANAAAGGGAC